MIRAVWAKGPHVCAEEVVCSLCDVCVGLGTATSAYEMGLRLTVRVCMCMCVCAGSSED